MTWRGMMGHGMFAVVVLAGGTVAHTQTVQSDQEALIELERRWSEAFYAKDLEFLDRVLADEFIVTYDDGSRGDKAKEIALARESNQAMEAIVPDEFTVRVYGNTAVVWFTLHLVGYRGGEPAQVTLRLTDVFVLRDGAWQCVSSQSTRVEVP